MTDIPKEYPEVVSAQSKMDHLLSELASLQKNYSAEVTTTLDRIPKNKYHGKVLQLCHDQGIQVVKPPPKGLGGRLEEHNPLLRHEEYTMVPCSSRKSDCGAPVVDFSGYSGLLQHSGDTMGRASDLNEAYNMCGSETGCAGFTGKTKTGPFDLYGKNGTYFRPPGWKENPDTNSLEPDASAAPGGSVAFIKDGMISTTADYAPRTTKSMGVPSRVTYTKMDNVRVLSQSQAAAYTTFVENYPDKEGAAEEFARVPIARPMVSSQAAPLPAAELQTVLDASNVNGTTSVIVGPGPTNETAAALVSGAALLPAKGWTSYIPSKIIKSLAALGSIPQGTQINTWIAGTDSALMRERCPVTCETECGNYYFVGADNVVRPIAKSLRTCGKTPQRIKVDMYQFLNDQGFKLSSEIISSADQCAINLLDWPEKQKISRVLGELTSLGDQVHARITDLRQQGTVVAKDTGTTENDYNNVAKAYQSLYSKLSATTKASQTLDQMVSDFDLRSDAAGDRYVLWACVCVALVALIIHIARK